MRTKKKTDNVVHITASNAFFRSEIKDKTIRWGQFIAKNINYLVIWHTSRHVDVNVRRKKSNCVDDICV